ncbi:tripeptidyl-peptidase 1 precursor [Dissoconium aciculare CBS 342.82]|uniref:tripeptidyl-peptidase II n=1 Tax=Dissoconium aciculare CBS 342.82 TaxID=1314786 RepID=A0A6J3LUK5_9PEZI|nr:tripeptidyl-peptidase 1 precursor [Dissoconium aciculare CBS 342.82]KAF1818954.1 tripeptidyl-peptidase 1 precursor [Dissoconium aciculare CBS 342.82]
MLYSQLAVAILAIGTANALPSAAASKYAVKERHIVPRAWTSIGSAPAEEKIHLQIGLRQAQQGLIEQHLLEVSDPEHPRYGQHLSHDEVNAIVAPADESVSLVSSWLEEAGISDATFTAAKDWVHVVIPIGKAEELLQTKYEKYRHRDGATVSRAKEWSLPLHLHEHIDVVQPTTSFFRPRRELKTIESVSEPVAEPYWKAYGDAKVAESGPSPSTIAAICNETITTPECIRTLYGTINYQPKAAGKNAMALANYLNETNKRSDTLKFLQLYRPDAAESANEFKIITIAGAPDNQGPYTAAELAAGTNIEGNLDVQQMLSIGYPIPLTAYSTGGSPPFSPTPLDTENTNEPYLVFLNYILAQKTIPQVLSSSYGDDEQTVPLSYADRVCSGFAQLGARGVSVFFSSGDDGVGKNGTCFLEQQGGKPGFTPDFPTGCPWVTSVGGTKSFQPEVAVSRFGSGAGFSNYFGQPSYQSKVVNAYVKGLNGKFDGLYNKSGRAYPDVAAQSNHDAIVWNGTVRTVGGTSASSPTFAAVIALVNDALIAAGKPSLGFLNPWLYKGAYKALTDVTSGSSIGCNSTGFPAAVGWDPVTGFGTPNFDKLVKEAFKKKQPSSYGPPSYSPPDYGSKGY